MELIEGLSIGPYRLVGRAGSGGMAEVWRAYDVRLKRYVAIKFLSPRFAGETDYLERFSREAQAISRLDHPNILTIHDYGEQEGWTYMVGPYLGGGTLGDRLRHGPWSVDEAVAVLEPLASALDYAHGRGVVHRDIKPSNVLFTEEGRLVLSDFGIARIVEGSTLLSQAGLVIGTPMYMSPEQADGQPSGPASDRYSLGIVAYEMLTGRPPFMGETPLALLLAHIHKPLPPPRSLNPSMAEAVEAVLFSALAKAPADRHPSALAFVAALRAAQSSRRRVVPPDPDAEPSAIHDPDISPAPPSQTVPRPQDIPPTVPVLPGTTAVLRPVASATSARDRRFSSRHLLLGLGMIALLAVGAGAWIMVGPGRGPDLVAIRATDEVLNRVRQAPVATSTPAVATPAPVIAATASTVAAPAAPPPPETTPTAPAATQSSATWIAGAWAGFFATPTAVAEEGVPVGAVLVADDFADVAKRALPNSPRAPTAAEVGYVEGEYRMKLLPGAGEGGFFEERALLSGEFSNVTVAVDARLVGDPKDASIRIGCRRHTSAQGFTAYEFAVYPDLGQFWVLAWVDGRNVAEDWPTVRPSSDIRRGNETNRLELTCAGPTIRASINGREVFSGTDSRHGKGGVFLALSNGPKLPSRSAGAEVRFDNLVVTRR